MSDCGSSEISCEQIKIQVFSAQYAQFSLAFCLPSIPLPDGLGGGGHVVGDVLLLGPGHQGRFAAPALDQ